MGKQISFLTSSPSIQSYTIVLINVSATKEYAVLSSFTESSTLEKALVL